MLNFPSLFVIGTDTGVGKTVVTALLAKKYLDNDVKVLPFKPVASGVINKNGSKIWADVSFLASVTGLKDDDISLYKFEKPLSPHLAAEAERTNIELEKIIEKFKKFHQENEAVIVEGAGGAVVPLNEKETLLDLAVKLELPVLIVSRPNLGTINHTALTVSACRAKGLNVVGVVINRYPDKPDEASKSNPSEIEKLTGVPVIGLIPEIDLSVEEIRYGELEKYISNIDLNKITLPQSTPIEQTLCYSEPFVSLKDKLREESDVDSSVVSLLQNDRYKEAIEADKQFVWHPFTPMQEYLAEEPHPLMIVKAKGSYLEDDQGKRYIDGVSSLWVNLHGHKNEELDNALKSQLEKVAHSTLLGLSNEPSALLAKKLVEITPKGLNKVFYSDNGSTAVEIGLKVAYQYWQQKGFKEKKEFVSFNNAYHGDTIGSVSVGGMDIFHSKFKALLFKVNFSDAAYCYRCPVEEARVKSREESHPEQSEGSQSLGKKVIDSSASCPPLTASSGAGRQAPQNDTFGQHIRTNNWPNCDLVCLDRLESILQKESQRIAAVVMEPKVQGAAGILIQPPGYLKRVSDLCKKYSVLLMADEVATGFGRTGEMFACNLEGVEPDIMALAKGITGGYLPLAATLFKQEIYDSFLGSYGELKTFFHGHTYTGNPLACAVALANLELLNKDFMDEVSNKSDYFARLLEPVKKLKHVGEVRQIGMMVGIELVKDKANRESFSVGQRMGRRVILKARGHGVIIRPLGDVIVLMPPLSISENELKHLVEATSLAIQEATKDGNC